MSLGFIFHGSQVLFSPTWFGNVREPKAAFSTLNAILHSFRMQGFYLIAGFFAIMILKKYGGKEFLKNRIQRLGIPFFFFGVTLNTVMVMVLLSRSKINPFSHIFSMKYFFGGNFQSHLWFLPNLILFCCFLVLGNKYFPVLIAKCSKYHFSLLQIYCLLMLLVLGFAPFAKYFPKSPYGNWFVFNARSVAYYFPFFILGVIFFLNKKVLDTFMNSKVGNISILLGAILLAIGAGALPIAKYIRYVLQFPIALSSNGLLFKFINTFFNYNNKHTRSISDASYTMYVMQQPILVLVAFYVVKTNLNHFSQFLILILAAWMITYLFHVKIVRRFPIVSFLFNGQSPKKIE